MNEAKQAYVYGYTCTVRVLVHILLVIMLQLITNITIVMITASQLNEPTATNEERGYELERVEVGPTRQRR